MGKVISALFGFLLSLLLIVTPVLAQSVPDTSGKEFSTTYDIIYEVGDDGVTAVTEKVALKNLTAKYFASKYTLIIGSTNLSDVTATDQQQSPLEVTTSPQGTKTQIDIKLNQQIAGQGKVQTFILKFKSKDFAQKIGKTWSVDIPKAPTAQALDAYNVVLSVPIDFGDPTSITPQPKSQSSTYNRLTLNYTKEQLATSGVSANFGSFQVFHFNLHYRLKGESLFPDLKSVPLPATTQYQDIALTSIDPKPLNVTIDRDGNYVAWYRLQHGDAFNVEVKGSAKIYDSGRKELIPVLSSADRTALLQADKYWEKDSPLLREKVNEIFKNGTPPGTKDKASLIYRYVADSLRFDVSRIHQNGERLGALTAINNPNTAVSQEFADLFVALSRAANIPAREVDGFALSLNQSLRPLSLANQSMHAWAQYYDESKGWVMVDPTWDNTTGGIDYFYKFDLNHISFLTRGVSSTQELPLQKVEVSLSDEDFMTTPQIQPTLQMRERIWAGLPYHAVVKVTNNGTSVTPAMPLTFTSGQLSVVGDSSLVIPPLPPFGTAEYTFDYRTPNFTKEYQETVEVLVGAQKITKQVTVTSLFGILSYPVLIGIIGLLSVWIYAGVLAIHIRQRKSHRKQS